VGPLRNDAQRRFQWVLRLSMAAKLAGLVGLLLLLRYLGVI
jgi:hypothetical protein